MFNNNEPHSLFPTETDDSFESKLIFGMSHSGITAYITDKDVFFAKERLKLHEATPDEGVSIDILKKYIYKKYGI